MNINIFFDGLHRIFASGNKEDVSGYLRKSLAEAEASGDNQAMVTILNEMVGYYRITSNHGESLKTAERVITLLRSLGMDDTVPYGTTLLNAGTAYKASGDRTRALELFNAALAIYQRHLPANDQRLAALYNNLSAIHQDAKDYANAVEYLEKSTKILSETPGAELNAATVYTNLALALFELGREEEGMQTLQRAIGLFKSTAEDGEVDPKVAPHYASALAGLAGACYRVKEYDNAAELYEKALEYIKEAYGENDDYFLTCRNCATAYEAAGNPDKARWYRNIADTRDPAHTQAANPSQPAATVPGTDNT